tara:strand:- start:18890 stop:19822 length:933 start_codon:yes stop_codon:yes gene_type:complete
MTLRFSVIIPLYNKEHFIANTIESVLKQSFSNYEILIINDSSTDNSLKIAQGFKDKRIHIVTQKNNGLSHARNHGIDLAQGEIIALLDADDIWLKDHLQVIDNLASHNPEASLFATRYEELYANGITNKPQYNLPAHFKTGVISNFFESNLNQPLAVPSSFAFKKDVANTNRFDIAVNYGEDVDFFIRVHLKYQFAFHNHTTCLYRRDSENQITKDNISTKNVTEFEKYLSKNPEHISLKKYINIERYFLAMNYKAEGSMTAFSKIKDQLVMEFLTPKQRFLLKIPRFLLLSLKSFKRLLILRGKRVTSF